MKFYYILLKSPEIQVKHVIIAAEAKESEPIKKISSSAQARGIPVIHKPAVQVHAISKHGSQDQGVVADLILPSFFSSPESFLEMAASRASYSVMTFDGVTTPGNLGLSIRSAVASGGIDAVLLAERDVPSPSHPLVMKASSGAIFHPRLSVVHCETLVPALEKFKADGAAVFGLDRRGGKLNLFTFRPPKRIVWVLGNEARGLGGDVRRTLTGTVSIPVDGVDSLNVAMAATLVAYRSHFMRPAREKRS